MVVSGFTANGYLGEGPSWNEADLNEPSLGQLKGIFGDTNLRA
jgi:hypothetical protein